MVPVPKRRSPVTAARSAEVRKPSVEFTIGGKPTPETDVGPVEAESAGSSETVIGLVDKRVAAEPAGTDPWDVYEIPRANATRKPQLPNFASLLEGPSVLATTYLPNRLTEAIVAIQQRPRPVGLRRVTKGSLVAFAIAYGYRHYPEWLAAVPLRRSMTTTVGEGSKTTMPQTVMSREFGATLKRYEASKGGPAPSVAAIEATAVAFAFSQLDEWYDDFLRYLTTQIPQLTETVKAAST